MKTRVRGRPLVWCSLVYGQGRHTSELILGVRTIEQRSGDLQWAVVHPCFGAGTGWQCVRLQSVSNRVRFPAAPLYTACRGPRVGRWVIALRLEGTAERTATGLENQGGLLIAPGVRSLYLLPSWSPGLIALIR